MRFAAGVRRLKLTTLNPSNQFGRRRFNTNIEEKSSFAEKAKKYSLILIPLAISLIGAVDIINDVSHRRSVESFLPWYVGLIREYYGFSDEDPKVMEDEQLIQTFFSNPLNVVVETKKGQMRYFRKQDPTRKVSSFLTEEFDHDISEIYVDRLNQISFVDDEIIGTAESQSQTQLIYLLGPGMSTLNSCWEQTVSCNRLEISDFILNKYSNYLEWISRGFEMYSAVTFPSHLKSDKAITPPTTDPRNLQKQFALEKIEQLQAEIELMEKEKLIGRRDIDSLDTEIAEKRAEILHLKRSYLNTFYYF